MFGTDTTKAPTAWTHISQLSRSMLQQFATMPFDMAREEYARCVRAGWLPRSMLAARDVSRTLDLCERLTLGPWARGA